MCRELGINIQKPFEQNFREQIKIRRKEIEKRRSDRQ
jgi:hypothetical protein